MSSKSPTKQEEKWTCTQCTYENYPSAVKCTMCAMPQAVARLPQTPSPTAAASGNEEAAQSVATSGASLDELDKTKWECKMCTYLNWPRGRRCVQCYTNRDGDTTDDNEINYEAQAQEAEADAEADTDTATATVMPEELERAETQLNELRIDGSDASGLASSQQQQCAGAAAASRTNSPITSPPAQAQAKQRHAVEDVKRTEERVDSCLIQKWACETCTYENWPKSMKCSMCGKAKDNSNVGAMAHRSPERIASNNATLIEHSTQLELTVAANNSFNRRHIYQLGSNETINNCDNHQELRQRQIRRQVDWQWLNACLGIVDNNYAAVEAYLSAGGNPTRALTNSEINALNRNSAFDVGHTLIHLAIRFHREEMLPMLLAQISGVGSGVKRVPSYVAPDLATSIRRHFANILRLRKTGGFQCQFVQEHATFSLPSEILELPLPVQEQLFDELLDRDAEKQLESTPPAINWSLEITCQLSSRLIVLWNRSAGDCLLDSAMQATWGVFDRDNTLRCALAEALTQCEDIFYARWKEYEMLHARMLHFELEETQWLEDWTTLLALASQPGASLEQLHIFVLAHILRRPIIVYGVKYVKSFRGEDIGYARFEGLYLPLFWDQNFCTKSPIALGYTRGHFSALVPMEPFSRIEARRVDGESVTYLPLTDCELKLLPIPFLTESELGQEESIMRQWLDVCVTAGGRLVAQQKLGKRPLLVAQMLEEWLNHYRRLAQVMTAPYIRRPKISDYSSDGDSEEE